MTSALARVLLLEDDPDYAASLARALRGRVELTVVETPAAARDRIADGFDVALVDLFLGDTGGASPEGLEFLRWAAKEAADVPLMILTGHGGVELAVEAMREGAEDFVEKGRVGPVELERRIQSVIERRQLRSHVRDLERRLEVYEPRSLVGGSRVMGELRRIARSVAEDGEISVLLRGETGTGKELVARMIHAEGSRRRGPLIAVDLSTLPRETLAAELFGHERGAFTGAVAQRTGFLEAANGGVLFLDEIGELSRDLQGRLLRVIEERSVVRLGSTVPREARFQLITATNQDLEAMVKAGDFRHELYYRLRVFEIRVPALRERPEDIAAIVEHYVGLWHAAGRTTLRTLSPEALERLRAYAWPGNVRELRNAIESASLHARMRRATVLTPDLLPAEILRGGPAPGPALEAGDLDVATAQARAELACAARALEQTQMAREPARRLLGYRDRHTMRRRLGALRERFPDLWAAHPALEVYFSGRSRRGSSPANVGGDAR